MMAALSLASHERVHVDLVGPLRTLTYPVAQLIIITGLMWLAIGYLDGPSPYVTDPMVRNGLVVIWLLLLLFRLLIPLWRNQRQVFMVTSERIVVRPAAIGGKMESIPLASIRRVRRHRNTIALDVDYASRPLVFRDISKAKKTVAIIQRSI